MRIALALACLLLTTNLSAQKLQDFLGDWRINPDKVQEKSMRMQPPPNGGPDIPPPPPPEHKYTPEKIRMHESVLKISGGEAGTTAVYTIDPSGKQVSDPIPDAPGSLRIASTHWSDHKLVTEWKLKMNGQEVMHGTDTRTLTPHGQQLVDRMIESPRHKAEVHLVLERVQ